MQNVEQTIISQYANSPTLVNLVHLIDDYIDPSANLDSFYDLVYNVMADGATLSTYGLDVWGRIVGVDRNLTIPAGSSFPGAPVNLLTWSEQFDNAAWLKGNSTIGVNSALSPSGAMTADKFTENAVGIGAHTLGQTVGFVSGTPYTISFHVKAAERTECILGFDPGAFGSYQYAKFNLVTGTGSAFLGSPIFAINALSDGWYRISLTATAATTINGNYWSLQLFNGASNVYLGDGVSGVYIWGAQLQLGVLMTNYIPTTSAPASEAATPGTYVLSNEDFRTLILVKALANITDCTAASVNRLLSNLFAARGRCYVLDLGDMAMQYVFEFYLQPFEYAIVTTSGAIPHPTGVQSSVYQVDVLNTFGFNEAVNLQPFNQGTFYPG